MATKTISVTVEAWERLRAARRRPTESFSQVILRARWGDEAITGRELLARSREGAGLLQGADLDAIEDARASDVPPRDKWST